MQMSEAFNAFRLEEPTQRRHLVCTGEYGIPLGGGIWHKDAISKTARHPAWSALLFWEHGHPARLGARAPCSF